jgi:hypothetical protein
MKQTKKTPTKLMFKQDKKRIICEKSDKGTEISFRNIDADEQIFTPANMLSFYCWQDNIRLK